jgi:hypothetical protein
MAGVCQTHNSILLNIDDSVILNIIDSAHYLLASKRRCPTKSYHTLRCVSEKVSAFSVE